MHSTNFSAVSIEQFRYLITYFDDLYTVDSFLSGDNFPKETISFIGIQPESELIIEAHTPIDEIKSFCFDHGAKTFGYLSYPYGLFNKGIPCSIDSNFPLGHLKQYQTLIKYDHQQSKLYILKNDANIDIQTALSMKPVDTALDFELNVIQQNTTKTEYIENVETVLDHIRAGDTYQLNLSIEFQTFFHRPPKPAPFFTHVSQQFPAPFYVYFTSADRQLISTSPERFLKVENGTVLSQPIKGTRKVSNDLEFDIQTLKSSPKESAELSMIVDLIRNDISEFCIPGTVDVSDHQSIFQVDQLLQMMSNVTGTLKEDNDVIDLLIGTFPGGSITGCPKKRSIELIEELEPHCRNIYCGTFFMIDDEKNMDSSIAIRTGYFHSGNNHSSDAASPNGVNNIFNFYAGSGIVIKSQPGEEYMETLNKAEKFFTIFNKESK